MDAKRFFMESLLCFREDRVREKLWDAVGRIRDSMEVGTTSGTSLELVDTIMSS